MELAERTGAALHEVGGGTSFPVGHPHDVTEGVDAAMAAADFLLLVEARDPTWALGPVDLHSRRSLSTWSGTAVASIGLAGIVDKAWMVAESSGPDRVDLTADPELALAALLDAWGGSVRPLDPAFEAAATATGPSLPDAPADARGIHRGHLGRAVAAALSDVEWTVSNGVIGNWSRRTLRFQHPSQFLGRSFAGGLGYGAGASLGAGLAYRGTGRVVVDLQGDGDFLYTPQALWTAAHHQIPVLFIIEFEPELLPGRASSASDRRQSGPSAGAGRDGDRHRRPGDRSCPARARLRARNRRARSATSTGASIGTVTRRKTCHSVAPSVRAASSTSRGIDASPAPDHDHREAGPDPDVGDHDRRRDQLGAEPADAAERLAERLRADRGLVAARLDVGEREGPVRRRRRRRRRFRRRRRSSTVTPGSPSSPFSTLPCTPPPGLKSRQTTPVIPPGSRLRRDGLHGALRHLRRAGSPSARAAPCRPA